MQYGGLHREEHSLPIAVMTKDEEAVVNFDWTKAF